MLHAVLGSNRSKAKARQSRGAISSHALTTAAEFRQRQSSTA